MGWLYGFSAREIQRYVLRSPKLQDMVGGSEIVNQLCEGILEKALKPFGVETDPGDRVRIETQAAGGARIRFREDADAVLFHSVWPLLVSRFAPGLNIVQALVRIPEEEDGFARALEECERELQAGRNAPLVPMPEVGPLVMRNPQTGLAASEMGKWKGKPQPVDRGTVCRRKQRERTAVLVGKFASGPTGKEQDASLIESFPLDIEDISGSDRQYVAVVHADGNDLGRVIGALMQEKASQAGAREKLFREFSKAVDGATVGAAAEAFGKVLRPDWDMHRQGNRKAIVAARPIVIGGDDMTVILRADLAFAFVQAYLESFEKISSMKFKEGALAGARLPDRLTACAGIAFVKRNYPFMQAYDLAEQLCSHAKKAAKKHRAGEIVPSCFSFHRVTSSVTGEYGEILKRELTVQDTPGKVLTMGPYAVGDSKGPLPPFGNLAALAKSLGTVATGSVRTLISTMYENPVRSREEFDRIVLVADGKGEGDRCGTALREALIRLTGNPADPLWTPGETGASPLMDAHTLRVLSPQS